MKNIPTSISNKDLVIKRREQIVRSAIRLFARKGYHKTTLEDLAKDLGMSHGSIYKYVGSKEDIFYLIHEFMGEYAQGGSETAKALEKLKDPTEKLRVLIRKRFTLVSELPDALLLMYRQSHILSKTLLKAVLKREREYLAEIEEVLEECVRKNYFRNLNPRIISNLITIMVDALVLKRWDLKDHSIAQELESSIFDLIFDGLSQKKRMEESRAAEPELEQKSALVITAEPLVGKEIASFLLSRGLALSIYSEHHRQKKDFLDVDKEGAPIRFYTREESGPMSGALLGDILRSSGPFDFLIFGLGPDCRTLDYDTQQYLGEKLTGKIHSVNSLEPVIEDAVRSGGGFRRIVYIGPSAWNRILDPIHYDLARAGAIAATRRQSRSMAAWQVSVNCIMPGFVLDDRVFGSTEETIAQVMEQIPFGRMGRIEDIATTVFFLLRDAPDYMTGQVLEMGGG